MKILLITAAVVAVIWKGSWILTRVFHTLGLL